MFVYQQNAQMKLDGEVVAAVTSKSNAFGKGYAFLFEYPSHYLLGTAPFFVIFSKTITVKVDYMQLQGVAVWITEKL